MDVGGNGRGPWVMLRQRASAFVQSFSLDISMFLIMQTLACFAAISILSKIPSFLFFGCDYNIYSYFWILAFFTDVSSLVSSVKRHRFSLFHSIKLLTNFPFFFLTKKVNSTVSRPWFRLIHQEEAPLFAFVGGASHDIWLWRVAHVSSSDFL
jgi:hypothetical protein